MLKKTFVTLILIAFSVATSFAFLVKGTVTDKDGEPIIGAAVFVKGDKKGGSTTDVDGNFMINVANPNNAVLEVTYVGCKPAEVKVNNQEVINITLEDDSAALDEVVVIGYGTTRARRDLTGSVGSVSGLKLAETPVTSAAVALQGKVAGVQVTTTDGQPGADVTIRVRGATSVTQSNEPLYIVDGFQTNSISDIPPTDILSIDILKDSSLTAIYGAKGGNGVVIVTTKSAKEGRITVNFNGQASVSHISKTMDLMDTYDFVNYQWDYAVGRKSYNSSQVRSFKYNFGHPMDYDLYKSAPTHDWQDQVMGNNPFSYMTNLSIGGGNDRTKFNISLTQSEDKGIILGSGVRRTNIITKLQTKITDNLTFQFNPKMSYRRDEGAGGDNVGAGGIIDVLRYRPTNGIREFGKFWPEGTYDPDQEAIFEYNNPVNDISTNARKKHSYTFTNQAALEWKPIENLTLRTDGVFNISFRDDKRFWGPLTNEGQKQQSLPLAQIDKTQAMSYTWTTTATYNFTLKEKNNFYALAGFELYHSQSDASTMCNRYFPRNISAEKAWNNMGLGEAYQSTTSRSTPDRTVSYFGQVNYNYDHKYLLSATFRADGSTMFAPGHQWGYFPSISGAWVISQENFMEDLTPIINELKLRAAIGKAGNNRIDADMWRYLYSTVATGGPGFGETSQYGDLYYTPGSYLPNPDIKWETTLTRNFALDMAFFNNRLRITPEYYWNTTSDLIYKSDILTTVGYVYQYQNIGQVTNRGFELTVSGDILQGRDYVLSANFNLGANKMVVDKLNGADEFLLQTHSRSKDGGYNYRLEVGGEVGLLYGFVYDGLYSFDEFHYDVASATFLPNTVDDNPNNGPLAVDMDNIFSSSTSGNPTLPGKPKFKDLNGDGIIDDNDRTVIGRTTPRLQGGFGLSGQWKNFDFSTNFTFFLDFDVYNATAYYLSSSINNSNKFYNVLGRFSNRWTYVSPTDNTECMYGNTWLDGKLDEYYEVNAGQTTWNPADLNKDVTMSYFVEDGSFLRCNDITLGYSLPDNIIKKLGMTKLRFYASVTNPFIITSYSGFDPEVDVQSGLTPSFDMNRYPRSRSYILGVNLSF